MNEFKRTYPFLTGLFLSLSILAANPAQAASSRVFVSGAGADSGTCGVRSTPCRRFAQALANVTAGGEIIVIDAADYGSLVIGKSVSVVNDGAGEAAVDGVTVNVAATDSVFLRGLTVNGFGASRAGGVVLVAGGRITIANCVIRNFNGSGVKIVPTAAMTFSISDTIVQDNTVHGVAVINGGGGALAGTLLRVQAFNNGLGGGANNIIVSGANATVLVSDSIVSDNAGGNGFAANSGGVMQLIRSIATRNKIGINSFTGTAAAGTIVSSGDNQAVGNTADVRGTLGASPGR
jgi:hypothetical protein